MNKIILFFAFVFATINSKSQSIYFPPTTGTDWETTSPASLGWCENNVDSFLNYLDTKNTKAFILLKDGKIVIEKYFGTFTQDSAWYWASAGKSLTSFMVGLAQQENYLSINDKTSKYLGEGWTNCSLEQENKITIRHQLTMTTGLDDGVEDPHCTIDTCLIYKADAGTRWAYHNGPYTVLDGVIENATGQTLNNYVYQKLKTKTGISGLYFKTNFDNVFYSKARSMARYGLLILNKGNWDGTQILTDTTYFNEMTNTSQNLNKSYGYLWWLNGKQSFMIPQSQYVFQQKLCQNAPDDMFAAIGKNGQFINVVPSQNLVFIRMGNAPDASEVPFTFNDTIWAKLNLVIYCGTTPFANYINNENKNLKVYPNPSKNNFYVEFENGKFDFQLFDVTGKLVCEKQNCIQKIEINTSKYQNGIYFVQVKTDKNEILNRKLMINQ